MALALSSAVLGLQGSAAVASMRAPAPAMAFKTDTPRPDLQSGLDFTYDKPWSSSEISDKAGLAALAKKLNPIVGYWDPLNIGETSKENIAWFRHAEIKHGRVAMAAFVGYLVGASGAHFPWKLTGDVSFADISAAGGPADQWDALPSASKMQILLFIGFLELWGESYEALAADGQVHYVRGGKPGYFPKMKGNMPHPIPLDFWDPLGLTKKMTPERKEQALLAEINNGRLAQLGIFGLVSASKGLIVPGLDTLPFPKYAGEIMAPFSEANKDLPFVAEMLTLRAEQIAREAVFLAQ